jgi:hypothetical protein
MTLIVDSVLTSKPATPGTQGEATHRHHKATRSDGVAPTVQRHVLYQALEGSSCT